MWSCSASLSSAVAVYMEDGYVLSNVLSNDVLCFISTSRHTLTKDTIIASTIGFYKPDQILQAKDTLFKVCKERPTIRKVCASHPNPNVADVADMIVLLQKMEDSNKTIPGFVASRFNSLPPLNFEVIASVICSMRDEISTIRLELSQVRESNQKDLKSMDDVISIKQDVADIKKICLIKKNPVIHQPDNVTIPVATTDESRGQSTFANVVRSNNNLTVNDTQGLPADVLLNSDDVQSVIRRSVAPKNPLTASQKQPPNRRIPPIRRRNRFDIAGSGVFDSGLSGVEKIVDLFVGGCSLQSTTIIIEDHCKSLDVNPSKVEELKTKSEWYKAFKISVNLSQREKLIDPKSWPVGVYVRKFFKPRRTGEDMSRY